MTLSALASAASASTSTDATTSNKMENGAVDANGSGAGNNNNVAAAAGGKEAAIPTAELSLLAKLEAANKLIENDAKSLNSLQSSAHSRKSSDTSQISLNSGL